MIIHHDPTLARRLTELKWSRMERRLSRSGRSGETSGTNARDSRKAYNKAHRKASKLQLRRYKKPAGDEHPLFTWSEYEDYFFDSTCNSTWLMV